MTRAQVIKLIYQAKDTRTVAKAEVALRAYLCAHPGDIVGEGETLHLVKTALKRRNEWDAALARTLADRARSRARASAPVRPRAA